MLGRGTVGLTFAVTVETEVGDGTKGIGPLVLRLQVQRSKQGKVSRTIKEFRNRQVQTW